METRRLIEIAGGGPPAIVTFADRWQLVAEAVVYVGRRMALRVEGDGWSVERGRGGDIAVVIEGVELPPIER